jgi:hypothetical protein
MDTKNRLKTSFYNIKPVNMEVEKLPVFSSTLTSDHLSYLTDNI